MTDQSAIEKFHAIQAQRLQLHEREEAILKELLPLGNKISNMGLAHHQLPKAAQKDKPVPPKVASLVEHVVTIDPPREPEPPKFGEADEMVAHARELSSELEAVREAIELLRGPEFDAMMKASQLARQQRAAEYAQVADKVVSAVVALYEGLAAHDAFTRDFQKLGLSWSFLKPLPLNVLGDDWPFRFAEFLRAANRHGHADLDNSTIKAIKTHELHRVEPATRSSRPETSRIYAGAPSVDRHDVIAVANVPAAVTSRTRSASPRVGASSHMNLSVLRRR